MNIRPATSEDRAAILALVPRLSSVGVPPWRDVDQIVATDAETVSHTLEIPQAESRVLVAESEGALLGFIHLTTIADYYTGEQVGHVADIVVSPHCEGRGVGRALMGAGEEWARSRGYPMMTLNVLVENEGPRAVYEKLGYSAEWVKYVKVLS
jgi:GNAT superfamily N-acetyltransferase